MSQPRPFLSPYEGAALDQISYPLGGFGTGMLCFDGGGAFSRFSVRHNPEFFNQPLVFSALSLKTGDEPRCSRVLEGPVAPWKFFHPWKRDASDSGGGHRGFGLPRFDSASFEAVFPFAKVKLSDPHLPIDVEVTAWNPFIPGDPDSSSLPVAAVAYRFNNTSTSVQEGVYSFHLDNFLAIGNTGHSVVGFPGGFELRQEAIPDNPASEASFAAWIDHPDARSNAAWFRGGWFDSLTQLWTEVERGDVIERGTLSDDRPSGGGSVFLPFRLAPGEETTIRLRLAWYVPYSIEYHPNPRHPQFHNGPRTDFYQPWYAGQFKDLGEVISFWRKNEPELRTKTENFSACFHDSTLPPEVMEAVAANLTILKSTTVLRQMDGRFWGWEGTHAVMGSCHGSCTHVWNYAQALPHLFPSLERSLREVEFGACQSPDGHQQFRASLPIKPTEGRFHAAADGQLGGLLKVYRDWRISGDTGWLRQLWPQVRKSLEYCIETWDPDHRGALFEPHHNTYDIEFWGANGMCTSFYLAALGAAIAMGQALNADVTPFKQLLADGRAFMERELFNGEYFIQKIQWTGLRSPDPVAMSKQTFNLDYSPEALLLLEKEGPKYQYGTGCLSDGILGEWMAWTAGLAPVISRDQIEQHLLSVYRYNFREDLATFANPQRPSYAFGHEAGLLLCTWPHGGKPALPFVYSDEVWTGIEYHVASHLISLGQVEKGLEIVRACRQRYDGLRRNPFAEIECGYWYARAMSSYALLQALTGARYDAVEKTLYVEPKIQGDFRSFLATAGGYGTVGIRNGEPFLEVKAGQIDVHRIEYHAA